MNKVYELVIFDPDAGQTFIGLFISKEAAMHRIRKIEKETMRPGHKLDKEEYEIRPVVVHQ